MTNEPIELLPATERAPTPDRRPRMPEPLPVRLVAIADVRLPAPAGVEVRLDAFYVDVLKFERSTDPHALVYHADNFDLRFEVSDRPVLHATLRPTGIQVPVLAEIAQQFAAADFEFAHQRGITPGLESLLLIDPAGNWVEITDARNVS